MMNSLVKKYQKKLMSDFNVSLSDLIEEIIKDIYFEKTSSEVMNDAYHLKALCERFGVCESKFLSTQENAVEYGIELFKKNPTVITIFISHYDRFSNRWEYVKELKREDYITKVS